MHCDDRGSKELSEVDLGTLKPKVHMHNPIIQSRDFHSLDKRPIEVDLKRRLY